MTSHVTHRHEYPHPACQPRDKPKEKIMSSQESYCGSTPHVDKCVGLIRAEFEAAREKFLMFNSPHEGYAVILEELDKLWGVIKQDYGKLDVFELREKMAKEAIQVAAMGLRFLVDVCGAEE